MPPKYPTNGEQQNGILYNCSLQQAAALTFSKLGNHSEVKQMVKSNASIVDFCPLTSEND
jgi:hypothetical protein